MEYAVLLSLNPPRAQLPRLLADARHSPKEVLWSPFDFVSIANFLWYKAVKMCNVHLLVTDPMVSKVDWYGRPPQQIQRMYSLLTVSMQKGRKKFHHKSEGLYYLWFHGVYFLYRRLRLLQHGSTMLVWQRLRQWKWVGGRLGNRTGWRWAGRVFSKSLHALWMQRCFLLPQQVPSYMY